jgi:3-hydroxyisobutyrate dehydrogenase-like beta-hydroxyacid dehydrogenase
MRRGILADTLRHIGWVGVGKMGQPMSRRVLKAGMAVSVFEPLLENRASIIAEGGEVAETLADLAKISDAIVLTIPNDAVLDSVIFGAEGLLEHLSDGQMIVEMSTVSPAISERVAEALADRGVDYLRAPVSGSTATAASGDLTVMVSGPAATYERAKPLFDCFAKTQFLVGEAEQARYLKLVVNALVGATSALVGEALALGQRGGLDTATMLEVITKSAVASPLIGYKRDMMVSGDFAPAFAVSQMMKDFDLILDAARGGHVPMTLIATIRQQYEAAFAGGQGDKDFFVLVEQSVRRAGLIPKQTAPKAGIAA